MISALPRVLVRAAVERYPDWWDTVTVGPPYQEAELYPLGLLHDLVDQLKLARRQRSILRLTPKARALRADPPRLLSEVAATLAPELPAEPDLSLARLVVDDQPDEIDWSLAGLLALSKRDHGRPSHPDSGDRRRTHPRRRASRHPRARPPKDPQLTRHTSFKARDPTKETVHRAAAVSPTMSLGRTAGQDQDGRRLRSRSKHLPNPPRVTSDVEDSYVHCLLEHPEAGEGMELALLYGEAIRDRDRWTVT